MGKWLPVLVCPPGEQRARLCDLQQVPPCSGLGLWDSLAEACPQAFPSNGVSRGEALGAFPLVRTARSLGNQAVKGTPASPTARVLHRRLVLPGVAKKKGC